MDERTRHTGASSPSLFTWVVIVSVATPSRTSDATHAPHCATCTGAAFTNQTWR